jgi:hypothetical protein
LSTLDEMGGERETIVELASVPKYPESRRSYVDQARELKIRRNTR